MTKQHPKPLPMDKYRRLRGDTVDWARNPPRITGTAYRTWREVNGYTQTDVMRMTGISRSTQWGWETGAPHGRDPDTLLIPVWATRALWEWGLDLGIEALPEEDTSALPYGEGEVSYADGEESA